MKAISARTPGSDRVRAELVLLIGLVVGTALIVFGTLVWLDNHRQPQLTFLATPGAEIAVDIRGAVATPGVIHLPPGARVIDAIDGAGGLTGDADRPLINLSARVHDGQMISIPTAPTSNSGADEGLININTATVAELTQLPGIGDVLAGRIVAYREFNGPYQTIDDLLDVDGISHTLVEQIRSLVTVSGGE